LENALPVLRDGREARFLFLPEGEDPDTLVRRIGADTFRQKTVESVPLSKFFYESLGRQVDITSVDGRARLVDLARPLLAKLPDSVFRDLMLEQLSEYSGLKLAQLQRRVLGETDEREPSTAPQPRRDLSRSPVRIAIRLLLEQPALGAGITAPYEFADLELPGIGLLVELLELTAGNPHLTTGGILEHWRGRPEENHLARLASTPLMVPADGCEQELSGAVQRLVEQRNSQRTDQLLLKGRDKTLDSQEKMELKQLLEKQRAIPGSDD
jgi:DNA primase